MDAWYSNKGIIPLARMLHPILQSISYNMYSGRMFTNDDTGILVEECWNETADASFWNSILFFAPISVAKQAIVMFIMRKTGREGYPFCMHLFARVVDSRVSLHDNFCKSRVVLNAILCFGIKIQRVCLNLQIPQEAWLEQPAVRATAQGTSKKSKQLHQTEKQ
jgi:hypothetical protein